MSGAAEARLSALDRVLDDRQVDQAVAADLFAASDALATQPTLRRALTDPGTPDDARAGMVRALFESRLGAGAVDLLAEAARLRWGTPGAFVAAVERQGVRALLSMARDAGQLDEIGDQLFKVERLVAGTPALRDALGDRRTPVEARSALIGDLVEHKVAPETAHLVRRAVTARQRTFALTLEGYLKVAAELESQAVATVEVARPLGDDQLARLTNALRRQVGRDVVVRVVVDPAVLGGVRVRLGDEVIEGTVASRLTDAHRKLG